MGGPLLVNPDGSTIVAVERHRGEALLRIVDTASGKQLWERSLQTREAPEATEVPGTGARSQRRILTAKRLAVLLVLAGVIHWSRERKQQILRGPLRGQDRSGDLDGVVG